MKNLPRLAKTITALTLAGLATACGSGGTTTPAAPAATPRPGPTPTATPVRGNGCVDSFDSTFEAIRTVVFERHGCTANACHGSGAAGGLDLRADSAWRNLVGAPSQGSAMPRVEPRHVNRSFLFQKLAARTDPSLVVGTLPGQPMPLSGDAVSRDELEAIRLWIQGGAPETGSVADEFGGSHVADLLDACLPPAAPVEVPPLEPPAPGVGFQLEMPPYTIPANSESEVCFAEYIDLRDRVPARFLTPDRRFVRVNGVMARSDPNTHHLTLSFSRFEEDMVNAPEFGRWQCADDGPRAGADCDPLDPDACGSHGHCRSTIRNNVACVGFGPPGGENGSTPDGRVDFSTGRAGFFAEFPSHGIFYWNSHAFDLTGEDLVHHHYTNVFLTDDLRFQSVSLQDVSHLGIAAGTPPFTRATYCADYPLPQGTMLLGLTSHTHKRGERFTIDVKSTGERLYDNPFWDDPVTVSYDPPRVFDSQEPADRTLHYCATYNNGVRPDGSPDPDTVTRLSRKPTRSSCRPTACAAGRVAEPCAGPGEAADATCDTSPGAGDGLCDACPITAGITSDDEMFVLIASHLVPVQ